MEKVKITTSIIKMNRESLTRSLKEFNELSLSENNSEMKSVQFLDFNFKTEIKNR